MVDVNIMGQAYKLSCKAGEESALQQAAQYLDSRMCAIRDAAKVKGNDRIAVMAALSMAAELLASKTPVSEDNLAQVKQKIATMHQVLDTALSPQEHLF